MVVYDHHFLIDLYGAIVYLADTDTTHIFIIINSTDQNLGTSIRITFRCRDIIQDRFK